jgi:hypothetical protein
MILNHISWRRYLEAVAILVAAYYLVLFFRFRGGSGRMLSSARSRKPHSRPFIEPGKTGTERMQLTSPEEEVRRAAAWDQDHSSDEPIAGEVDILIRKIRAVVAYSASEQCDQRYLSDTLRTVIRHYPGRKDDAFREAVMRLIQAELELYEFPELSEEDMNDIWIV